MSRRTLRFPDFLAVLEEVSRLESGYTKTKNWNLTQISEHLTKAMNGSMHGFKTPLYPLPKRIVGHLLLPLVLKIGIREGVKAPAAAVPRETTADDPAVIQTFRQTIAIYTQHRGPYFPHPFFGTLTPKQWQKLHLLHAAHHLSFLTPKDS